MAKRELIMVSRALLLGFMLAASGCGTALKVTSMPYRADTVERLRRGAHVLGCREQASKLFDVFFACPRSEDAIGVNRTEGKLTLTCHDLWPRNCVRLYGRISQASTKKVSQETTK